MKKFKHLFAAGAALAMALAFTMMPSGVFATTNTGTRPTGANDPAATINKTWNKPDANTPFPTVEATFTIVPVTATSELSAPATAGNNDYKRMPVLGGEASALTPADTVKVSGPRPTDASGTVTQAEIPNNYFDANNFPNAGIYRYKISETAVSNSGYSMSTESYYIDVVVENAIGGGLKIADYICWNIKDLTTKVASLDFTDTYSTTGLTLKKVITGTQANMNDTFDFQVKLTSVNPKSTTYQVGSTGSGRVETLTPDPTTGEVTETFTGIGNNGGLFIYGMQAGDQFEITEGGTAADQGYTTKITATPKKGGTAPVTNINDADRKITGAMNANTASGGLEVLYTNTRDGVIPTGFFTTYAPYLAGVAVIGGLGYAMFRRKKED